MRLTLLKDIAIITFFSTAISLNSCSEIPAADPDILPFSLVPGECLNNTVVKCRYAGEAFGTEYRFVFDSDMSISLEHIKFGEKKLPHHYTSIRYVPSDSVFKQFGDNYSSVKKEYESTWDGIAHSETTVYLNDGFILTADKEFGGIPAGENLARLFGVSPGQSCVPLSDNAIIPKDLAFRLDSPDVLLYRIDLNNYYEPVKEDVRFSLSVPVRVVYYLTWLNDKLTDENASMTWKDEVLTCTFSSNTGLKVKE
jgi:hypothetical protein